MNNKKGFSLVELLATITILGVISTIGIVSVNALINNSKKNYYKNQRDNMISAAQVYFQDHRSLLPKEIGSKKEITLNDLITNEYIDGDLLDTDKKTKCDKAKSKVQVVKINYVYSGVLNCPSCGGKDCEKEYAYLDEGVEPEVSIKFTEATKKVNGKTELDYKAHFEVKSGPHIVSYSYKIYKNGIIMRNTGNIKGMLPSAIDVSQYTPGTVKIAVSVTNSDGKTATISDNHEYKSSGVPSCGNISGQDTIKTITTSDNKTITTCSNWSNKREISITCENKLGGFICARPIFYKNFIQTSNKDGSDFLTIYDTENEAQNCQVSACVDVTQSNLEVYVYKLSKDGKIITGSEKKVTDGQSLGNYSLSDTFGIKVKGIAKDSTSYIIGDDISTNTSGLSKTASNVNSLSSKKSNNNYIKTESTFEYNVPYNEYGYRVIKLTAIDAAKNNKSITFNVNVTRISCAKGTYLKKGETSCTKCLANNYCLGGEFVYDSTKDQGIISCPSTYSKSDEGADAKEKCYRDVTAGKKFDGTNNVDCEVNTYSDEHKAYFGGTDKCSNCPTTHPNSNKGSNAKTKCYRNVNAGKYYNGTSDTNCKANTYSVNHNVFFNNADLCTNCPSTHPYSSEGATAKTKCYRAVSAGYYFDGETDVKCAKNTYKAKHNVNSGSKDSCDSCPSGTETSGKGATSSSSCVSPHKSASIVKAGYMLCPTDEAGKSSNRDSCKNDKYYNRIYITASATGHIVSISMRHTMNDWATTYCGSGTVKICATKSKSSCDHNIGSISLSKSWLGKGKSTTKNYTIDVDSYANGSYYITADSTCSDKKWEFINEATQIFKVS